MTGAHRAVPFRVGLRVRFRGVQQRSGVLLQGPAGWGEFSPFPEYPPAVAARWWQAAHEGATSGWPRAVRDRIPVNAIVPAVAPQTAHDMVRAAGCATAKVKVAERGQRLDDDIARCEAVRDALGPAGRLRVDANGAWDVDGAVRALRVLDRFDLEYAEQPVATLEQMACVRRRVDVPLAADESIRHAADPLRVAGLGAADVVVLKVQPLGGVAAALAVAEAAGLPAVVSSAVETSVGLAAGVALAAALPDLPYACGLGSGRLLDGDVVADRLVPVGGWLDVRRVAPRADLLERHRPDAATAARLLRRLDAARAAADPPRAPTDPPRAPTDLRAPTDPPSGATP